MPRTDFRLKPSDKTVKEYYASLAQGAQLQIDHELGVRHAFEALLDRSAHRHFNGGLAREYSVRRGSRTLRPDGCVLDEFRLTRGWYEAKSAGADLEQEARAKLAQGYPRQNTLFWQPGRVLLYQGSEVADFDITEPTRLVDALRLFFEHAEPELERWEEAVSEFKERVPELARGVLDLIHREKRTNRHFRAAFDAFMQLCQTALNPNISMAAVEEMLIQHLLTERIFRRVFENPDFTRRNAIAAEIEKVIDALMSRSFSRQEFLKSLDPFYAAIEATAAGISDFSQKQGFLNTVYEQFFQGFSVKIADTHGIVYTPQPIVEFMVRSVDELLASEFGTSLAAENVHVLDPFVGTGNFLIRALRQIDDTKKSALPQKYASELHANEVMLLPYYIASLNIEHTYYELTGGYEPFEGICLVDTFELAEDRDQPELFTEANTARVERQKRSPIRVVIGNPPYNVGQINENDNNKNRPYPEIEKRVRETYARASNASSTASLDDPYIKAIRWATDRIGDEGIVAFISNNHFIDGIATDGMRSHLAQDFDLIYHLDFKGNARTAGEQRRKEGGNLFDDLIRVGVGISIFVRRRERSVRARIFIHRVEDYLGSEAKKQFLIDHPSITGVQWAEIRPDERHVWLTHRLDADFQRHLPMGARGVLASGDHGGVLFEVHSPGVTSARDTWAYNFDREAVGVNMRRMMAAYNDHAMRWPKASREDQRLDDWVESSERVIAWSEGLKNNLRRGRAAEFSEMAIRRSFFRPYTVQFLYYDPIVIERPRLFHTIFPNSNSEDENRAIVCTGRGSDKPFLSLCCNGLVDYHLVGAAATAQVFPFYIYDSDGARRHENITDWSLNAFRAQYHDPTITKWDIFHYVYAVLHHPIYSARYAGNLRRDLPRIPFSPDFRPFAEAGARLVDLHVNYEDQPEFPLVERWKEGAPLDFRVERMKYDPASGAIVYNDALTLSGIPSGVERYRLGHRSALGWIVDQYRVTTDNRSGIVNDPNREDDPKYILRLIGTVATVSLETVRIVESLPDLGLREVS